MRHAMYTLKRGCRSVIEDNEMSVDCTNHTARLNASTLAATRQVAGTANQVIYRSIIITKINDTVLRPG